MRTHQCRRSGAQTVSSDPYTPPTAPVEDIVPETGLPWHMIAAIGFLALRGGAELYSVILGLSRVSSISDIGLLHTYVFVLHPVLILTAAYLMYRRSRHALIPIVVTPIGSFLIASILRPGSITSLASQPGTSYFSKLVAYFAQFPWWTTLTFALFLACAAYCFWLRRRGVLT